MKEKHNLMISLVIPCYNEEKNLKKQVLESVLHYLEQQVFSWEVIIVNDESTDKSKQLIEDFMQDRPGIFLLDIPHGGKPAAVWAGIQKAKGDIVLFTDMDQSTPIREFDKLLPWYAQGFDVVIGSRGNARGGFSGLRKTGSFVFRNLRRLFLLRDINDTQCGFKSCRREIASDIFPRLQFFQQTRKPTGWKVSAYDVELLYLFELTGHRIKEVPVEWYNYDQSTTKSTGREWRRYLQESIEMAQEVFRVKLNQLRGLYDESVED